MIRRVYFVKGHVPFPNGTKTHFRMTKQYRSWFAPDVAGVIMEDYLQEASNSGLEPERVIIDCLTKVV